MARLPVVQSATSNQNLEAFLTPAAREQVQLGDARRGEYLGAMNTLNSVFKQVLELTCSYRIELGITLQRLVESYNSLFLLLMEVSYTKETKVAGRNEYAEKMQEFDMKLEEFAMK
jgi:hypothetical protein